MKRFLLALVLFGAAILVLRRLAGLFGPARERRPRRGNSAGRVGREGATELVRDKVCNTFLPRSKALELTTAGETHYFCSADCRSKFSDRPANQADVARHA